MHIKKLEICGFKSFVDRTVIHFDHDVIGIVGPNGCGKSNIVDAIRWCIGEQSAKHLRGRSMSDVIFAGSESRGPHGMAEVTLTFDNTDREAAAGLPSTYRDYADIAVTRRLYRDGTSEYLINKADVRLKDVTDLFLGTGVGTKAYSIIEQGKIGLIVSARAEDRRLLIEEAAGITKYKARRKQAEQKMDLTRQNLLRVGDIVSEIERNLGSLKRQAQKAERYVSYKNEVEDLVLHEASHKLIELIVTSQVAETGQAEATEEERARRAELDAQEAELETLRFAVLEREDAAEKAQTEAYRADNEVRVHEGEIARAHDRHEQAETRSRAAEVEVTDLTTRRDELSRERDALSTALSEARENEEAEADRMREETTRLEALVSSERAASSAANDVRREAGEARAAVAAATATLASDEQRTTELNARLGRNEDERHRLTLDIEEATSRRDTLACELDVLAERRDAANDRRVDTDERLRTSREEAVAWEKRVEAKRATLHEKRSRLRALEDVRARLEGVGRGQKALAATNDPTLRGMVADRFEAPMELTRAFAAALGEKLTWAVVDDARRGVELLATLSSKDAGRAAIFPEHPAYVAGDRVPDVGDRAFRLIDRMDYAPGDEALAQALFGDLLVVADEVGALELRASGTTNPIVTLGGTVFQRDGSVYGGAEDRVAEGLLAEKREIRELHGVVAEEGSGLEALIAEQDAHRARMTELGRALDLARNEAHEISLSLATKERDHKSLEEKLASLTKRLEAVTREIAEITAALVRAAEQRQSAEASLESARERERASTEIQERADLLAEEGRRAVARQQEVVTERRVLLAQVRTRREGAEQTVLRLARSCDEMTTRIDRLRHEEVECAVVSGQAAAKMMLEKELLLDAVATAFAATEAAKLVKIALDAAREGVASREVDMRGLRTALDAAAERLRTHETALVTLSIERRHLLEGVAERFRGLDLPTVVGDYHKRPLVEAAHRARIGELTQLIDRMGPVNVDAVREHAEAEERFTYYSGQKADLDRALADLEQAITQMNRESKRLFRETYDGINQRFKVLFPRMFRGGSAELRLTNPDDLLETGIEILAQPPGKKLSSIELMSGGEKALTAVSLIFAIFQIKPSPFCILDEVDAPLDEANVARYHEGIRSMTDRSQFILITHIKKTMQSVDVLYGVTMQEPGVSKLVGVKVNDTASARSTRPSAAAPAPVADAAVA